MLLNGYAIVCPPVRGANPRNSVSAAVGGSVVWRPEKLIFTSLQHELYMFGSFGIITLIPNQFENRVPVRSVHRTMAVSQYKISAH